jgi:hypothetical protein
MMLPVRRTVKDLVPRSGEISEEKLETMIGTLHDAADPLGRRCALRVPVEDFVNIEVLGADDGAWSVGVYDMSRQGIAIVTDEPMESGVQFNVLFRREHKRPIEVLCTVRHCRRQGDGYIIGAEFGVSWLDAVGGAMGVRVG